jgi:hypothetical protein
LLVQVSSLLSDDIQLLDLIFDDSLSLLEGTVDSSNLILDFLDLFLSIFDHLITLLDLLLEMVGELLFLSLLEVFEKELLSLLKETSLLVAYSCHGSQ